MVVHFFSSAEHIRKRKKKEKNVKETMIAIVSEPSKRDSFREREWTGSVERRKKLWRNEKKQFQRSAAYREISLKN